MAASKLMIENFIFARAAFLGVAVDGIRGKLATESWDPYMQVFILIYNQCFSVFYPPEQGEQTCGFVPEIRGGIKNGWMLPAYKKIDNIIKLCYNK